MDDAVVIAPLLRAEKATERLPAASGQAGGARASPDVDDVVPSVDEII
jgi:hypothetical protein